MRLGIFGGSFDPVHYGHLLLAECCREQGRLDRVLFVPAASPPHKQDHRLSPAEARVQMLRLATGGHEAFEVSTVEIDRGGVSYTVDTLTALSEQQPEDALFFLLGSDSLHDLPHWREPGRICQLATPLVVQRPGEDAPDVSVLAPFLSPERLNEIREHRIDMPAMGISASDIRAQVAAGRSIRYRTPRAIEKYIQEQGLYRE